MRIVIIGSAFCCTLGLTIWGWDGGTSVDHVAELRRELADIEAETNRKQAEIGYLSAHQKRELSIQELRILVRLREMARKTGKNVGIEHETRRKFQIHELNKQIRQYERQNRRFQAVIRQLPDYVERTHRIDPSLKTHGNLFNSDVSTKYYYKPYDPSNPHNPHEWRL